MSRFREEFFKKATKRHDELMSECLTREGKQRIWSALLGLLQGPDTFEKVWVCDTGLECCTSQDRVAWRVDEGKKRYCRKSYRDDCEYFDPALKKDPRFWNEERGRPFDVEALGRWVEAPAKRRLTYQTCNHEIEVPCKTGRDFYIGYADILLTFRVLDSRDLHIAPDWVWKNYRRNFYPMKVVVEVKPNLETFSSVTRQLKTYMECLRAQVGVVATYSNVPDATRQILLNENITIAKFPQKKGNPEGEN